MLDILSALLPIVFLIGVMTKPNPWSSPIAFAVTATLAFLLQWFYFGAGLPLLLAAITTGLLNALTPVAIVLGAIFFFVALEKSGAIQPIKAWLRNISPNPVAQLMIAGWSFMFLLEGAAGFGTPAALAAPILVGLGFPALKVAALCLVFNAIPTPFGAVGTPIWFGFENLGLDEAVLRSIGWQTALWQFGVALFVPLAALRLVVDTRTLLRNLPFALLSVLYCVVPMLLLSAINYEFPTVAGGSLGLILSMLTAKFGVGLKSDDPLPEKEAKAADKPEGLPSVRLLMKALLPIAVTVSLLLLTRMPGLPFRSFLTSGEGAFQLSLGLLGTFSLSPSLVFSLDDIWGQGLNWSHALLYVPSLIPFAVTAVLALLLFGNFVTRLRDSLVETRRKIGKPVIALFGALVLVQILMTGGDSAPTLVIGRFFAEAAGANWTYLAPFLGALGSFFSGSATISNLTFGGIQYSIAGEAGLAGNMILALQSSGAAMGNMICIHNIIAVSAVLGLVNREGAILKTVVPIFLFHGAVLTMLVFFFSGG